MNVNTLRSDEDKSKRDKSMDKEWIDSYPSSFIC